MSDLSTLRAEVEAMRDQAAAPIPYSGIDVTRTGWTPVRSVVIEWEDDDADVESDQRSVAQ